MESHPQESLSGRSLTVCPELAQAWRCSCSCALVVKRKALVSQVDRGESVGRASWGVQDEFTLLRNCVGFVVKQMGGLSPTLTA